MYSLTIVCLQIPDRQYVGTGLKKYEKVHTVSYLHTHTVCAQVDRDIYHIRK